MTTEPTPRLNFDPFAALPWGDRLRELRTRQLAWLFPLMLLWLLVPSVIEGTLGSPRPIADLRLALGASDVPSPPDFPLLRDTPTLWFALTIAATCILVHLQWRLMARCVESLERSGAIKSRASVPPRSFVHIAGRLLGNGEPGDDALNVVIRQMNRYLRTMMQPAILMVLAAIMALLVIVGEQEELFAVIAPDGLSETARAQWLQDTYDNWWAGTGHYLGVSAYFVVAMLGIWVILAQNVVGLACSYFVLSLFQVAEVRADWLNRDGKYGWLIIARIFRTVYVSLLLHAAALTVLLVALGPTHIEPVIPLLILWLFVAPLYVLGSWLIFSQVEKRARDDRIEELSRRLESEVGAQAGTAALAPYAWEIQRAHDARIRPLRLRSWRVPTTVAVIALPIAIAITQQALTG